LQLFQWNRISRIRLLPLKGRSRHGLAVAVSRTLPPLFTRNIPFEVVPTSATEVVRTKSLKFLVNLFARSTLTYAAPSFKLSALLQWLLMLNPMELQSILKDYAHDISTEAEVEKYTVERYYFSSFLN
jgi:hypothetical protein